MLQNFVINFALTEAGFLERFSFCFQFKLIVNMADYTTLNQWTKYQKVVLGRPSLGGTWFVNLPSLDSYIVLKKKSYIFFLLFPWGGKFCILVLQTISNRVIKLYIPLVRQGRQTGGFGHKWIRCVITHLSIYDLFIYRLIIHYLPNSFNQ